jgi:hypothetical protein
MLPAYRVSAPANRARSPFGSWPPPPVIRLTPARSRSTSRIPLLPLQFVCHRLSSNLHSPPGNYPLGIVVLDPIRTGEAYSYERPDRSSLPVRAVFLSRALTDHRSELATFREARSTVQGCQAYCSFYSGGMGFRLLAFLVFSPPLARLSSAAGCRWHRCCPAWFPSGLLSGGLIISDCSY